MIGPLTLKSPQTSREKLRKVKLTSRRREGRRARADI